MGWHGRLTAVAIQSKAAYRSKDNVPATASRNHQHLLAWTDVRNERSVWRRVPTVPDIPNAALHPACSLNPYQGRGVERLVPPLLLLQGLPCEDVALLKVLSAVHLQRSGGRGQSSSVHCKAPRQRAKRVERAMSWRPSRHAHRPQ